MAEINNGKNVKTVAFYLPQYHEIPENNKWWGDGFTEWTNTRKARPLFQGHYQPKVPLNKNYYNLINDESIMIKQASMAKKYGVWGFCYYHYWFKGGKKLLEKPVERMLQDQQVDIPFCLCWANENWSRNWDGGNHEVIMEQDYGGETEWEHHFQYLLEYFKDKRYITFDGRPIMVIYKPQLIIHLNEMLDYWQKRAQEHGLKGLVFAYQYPAWFFMKDYDPSRFQYMIKFEPVLSSTFMKKQTYRRIFLHKIRQMFYRIFKKIFSNVKIKEKKKELIKGQALRKVNYDEVWRRILNGYNEGKMLAGAFTEWDNTARNKNGIVYVGASPKKFEKYMSDLIAQVAKKEKDRVVFINAWNEWGEGCYLEPDEKHKYAYLESLKTALIENQVFPCQK